ncbi:hypothetical protein M0802_006704 [Mischocyttarus mexicanus]|nr:hypothetical protein M0802_006704 [Mischocyttarus mexicanus]
MDGDPTVHGSSEISQLEGLLFSIATFSGRPSQPMVGVVFVSSNEPMTLQRRRTVDKERRENEEKEMRRRRSRRRTSFEEISGAPGGWAVRCC